MAPPPIPSDSTAELRAAYKSPTGDNKFSHRISAGTALDQVSEHNDPAQFSKAKTAYMSELRSSVKDMQGEINAFLTAKMEEDKNTAATNGAAMNGKGKDEVEEENYGEEDVEED
jgi:hypothetical protein